LRDKKCQQELLGIPDLTVVIALQKATTAEVVSRETAEMQEATSEANTGSDVHKLVATAVAKQGIILQFVNIKMQSATYAKRWAT